MSTRENTLDANAVLRRCLNHWSYRKDMIIPRCCLPGWEADLLIIKPSGWAEEVEIKVSGGDFRAEWKSKAEKHRSLLEGRSRYVYGPELARMRAESHPHLELRSSSRGYQEWGVRDQPSLIRRFWFAMPASLAERLLPEVPEHLGVLAVSGYCNVLRPAANLPPARKVTDAERLHALHSTYSRFWQRELWHATPTEFLQINRRTGPR